MKDKINKADIKSILKALCIKWMDQVDNQADFSVKRFNRIGWGIVVGVEGSDVWNKIGSVKDEIKELSEAEYEPNDWEYIEEDETDNWWRGSIFMFPDKPKNDRKNNKINTKLPNNKLPNKTMDGQSKISKKGNVRQKFLELWNQNVGDLDVYSVVFGKYPVVGFKVWLTVDMVRNIKRVKSLSLYVKIKDAVDLHPDVWKSKSVKELIKEGKKMQLGANITSEEEEGVDDIEVDFNPHPNVYNQFDELRKKVVEFLINNKAMVDQSKINVCENCEHNMNDELSFCPKCGHEFLNDSKGGSS